MPVSVSSSTARSSAKPSRARLVARLVILLTVWMRYTAGGPAAKAISVISHENSSATTIDATALAVEKTYVGNIKAAAKPERSLKLHNDGDMLADLAVFYSARVLSVMQDAGSIGLHYRSADGTDYLVPDIFALGERVPLVATVVIPRTDEGEDEEPLGSELPTVTALLPSYPNPFNPSTTLEFHLVEPSPVFLEVYDARGAVVRTLVDARRPAGVHRVVWDGRDGMGMQVATGVYFARFVAGDYQMTQKLVLLK